MKTPYRVISGIAFCAAAVVASAARTATVDLPERIQTILQRNCAVSGCHRGHFPAKKLNLTPGVFPDNAIGVASREAPGMKLVDSADPDKSYLLMKVAGREGIAGKRMPLGRKPLEPEEIQALLDWIDGLER